MCVIFNFAAAQPFVKVRDVIALDPPLSTACQNTSLSSLQKRAFIQEKRFVSYSGTLYPAISLQWKHY